MNGFKLSMFGWKKGDRQNTFSKICHTHIFDRRNRIGISEDVSCVFAGYFGCV